MPGSTLLAVLGLVLVAVSALAACGMLPRFARGSEESVTLVCALAAPVVFWLAFAYTAKASGAHSLAPWLIVGVFTFPLAVSLLFLVVWIYFFVPFAHERFQVRWGALQAVGICIGGLLSFGSMVQTRVTIVPDPDANWRDLIDLDLVTGLLRMSFPVVVVLGAMAVWRLFDETYAGDPVVVRWLRRPGAWLTRHPTWTVGALAIPVAVGYGLPLVGALLPRIAHPIGGAYLEVLGVPTAEFGKIVLFFAFGLLCAREDRTPSRGPLWDRRTWMRGVDTRLPVLLLGLALVLSVLRSDLGCAVAAVAGYSTVRLTVFARLDSDVVEGAGRRGSWRTYPAVRYSWRLAAIVGVTVVMVGFLATVTGKASRFETWADPYQYPWSAPCTPVDESPLAKEVAHAGTADPTPPGVTACVVLVPDEVKSYKSQTARGLVSIEGGGLFGRGPSDSQAGMVGATGRNDLVVAQVWSKFGGLVLVLIVALLALFAGALRTVVDVPRRWEDTEPRARTAYLFAVAIGAGALWQGIYLLAADANVLPLSGVWFPMLSEGIYALTALLLSLLLVVALCGRRPEHLTAPILRWSPGVAAGDRDRPSPLSPASYTAVGAGAFCLVWGLVLPFASLSPQDGALPDLDEGLHKNDVLAHLDSGSTVTARVGGHDAFEEVDGHWSDLKGEPISLDHLSEFLTAYGSGFGAADDSLGVETRADHGFWSRLWTRSPSAHTTIDLTVDPGLQNAAGELIRKPEGSTRIATGITVLDPRTGHVLALGSAPGPMDTTAAGRRSNSQQKALEKDAERLNKAARDGAAQPPSHDSKSDLGYYRVGYQVDDRPSWDGDDPFLSSFSFIGSTAEQRKAALGRNRAIELRYAPGSVFKIVVATAYLEHGGHIDDPIPSPATVTVGDHVVNNVYNGLCPGTAADGTLSVADALAVSCNTSFVLLAQKVTWPVITATATYLGLTVDDDVRPCTGLAASFIPSSDAEGISNLALGGGSIHLSTVAVASLVGAIANRGVLVEPGVVTGAGGAGACDRRIMSRDVADQLAEALVETGSSGTLEGLAPDGVLSGKTGTAVLDQPTAGGVDHYLWIAGLVATHHGPLAFAMVAESQGTDPGRTHVRDIATALTTRILDEYGTP